MILRTIKNTEQIELKELITKLNIKGILSTILGIEGVLQCIPGYLVFIIIFGILKVGM